MQLTNTVGTVSLIVISVNTTFYICKNRITNERYTLCMYHVAYHVTYHVASHFYCLVFYMLVCRPLLYICESNSVELPLNFIDTWYTFNILIKLQSTFEYEVASHTVLNLQVVYYG